MGISSKTAASLGEKLAGLELTDEEGALLATLLQHESAEVAGFGQQKPNDPRIMFETFRQENLPRVLGPLPSVWKAPAGKEYIVTADLQDW